MLAVKWQKAYSQVCGFINARVSIAIVRVTHFYACEEVVSQHTRRAHAFTNGEDITEIHRNCRKKKHME